MAEIKVSHTIAQQLLKKHGNVRKATEAFLLNKKKA
jgi:hypothetical protein